MKAGRAWALASLFVSLGWSAAGAEGDTAAPAAPEAMPQPDQPASARPASEMGALIDEISDVYSAVAALELSSKSRSEQTAKALADLKMEVEALRRQTAAPGAASGPDLHVSKALEDIQDRLGRLERLLVLGNDPASTALAAPRLAVILSGLAALLSVVAIAGMFWIRPGSRGSGISVPASVTKQLGEIHGAVTSARPAPEPGRDGIVNRELVGTFVQTANTLRVTSEKSARIQGELAALVEQLRSFTEAPKASDEPQGARGAEGGKAPATGETVDDGKLALLRERIDALEKSAAAYEAFWPAPFQGSEPLSPWKERLVRAFGEGSADAGALLTALIRWQLVARGPDKDRERWIEAVDAVGRASLAFLAHEPTPDDFDPIERSQVWTRVFKTLLEENFPSLKLSAVYPGDRFDTDRMEAVGSVSGGRQSVKRAMSWSILEKSGDSTRVLRRAQVITA